MTQEDYENKKRECWHEYFNADKRLTTTYEHEISKEAFYSAFDRAYALGREKETITQRDVEKAAQEHADELRVSSTIPGALVPMLHDIAKSSYLQGAQDFLGKKEKDAEDSVIQGWVAVDEAYSQCFLHTEKPTQKAQPIADTGDYDTVWDSNGKTYLIDTGLFPDMDSDSDPLPVEIIIKRKKK